MTEESERCPFCGGDEFTAVRVVTESCSPIFWDDQIDEIPYRDEIHSTEATITCESCKNQWSYQL